MQRNRMRWVARMCTVHTVILLAVSVLAMRSVILPAAREEVLSYALSRDAGYEVSFWCRTVLPGNLIIQSGGDSLRCIATELTTGIMDALLVFAFLSALLVFLLFKFRMYRTHAWMLWIPFAGLAGALLQSASIVHLIFGSHKLTESLYPWITACGAFHAITCMFTLVAAIVLTWLYRRSSRS